MFFNSAYFSICLWLSESQYFVCLVIIVVAILKESQQKNFSEGVNKQNEAIGSIMKHHDVSESFRRCKEASGSIRKTQHQSNNKQNTVALKPQVDSKIRTVKKHCQLLTSLIKRC